ncbi:MAG: AAA family ATPase [bacterium]|nr:AAA family ATPase [bacterium]
MYLRELNISRFRSCKETVVEFQKELTVLVGENNGGKSNILDAIRLLTAPLNGRRERYAEDTDLRHGSDPAHFEIAGRYDDLSDTLKGLLISAVPDPTKNIAAFGCRYEPRPGRGARGRYSSWAGKFDTTEPESGSTDLIRHVYLPALRDAHQALGSGGATRVMALLRHFLPEAEQQQFIDEVQRGANMPDVLTRMNTDIGDALTELTSGVRPQTAQVNFGSESVQDIARDLRFKIGDSGGALDEIRTSGLGYSNLLYMATVIVELTKAKEADLTLFLVEEPEAHLHPQLQMMVLEFLLEKATASFSRDPISGQPEGRIQVIVSTHSPNLTAWASPKHLVVVRSHRSNGDLVPSTACVPVSSLGLPDPVLSKINRYLDVTRSALLFGSHAALVEGIAEALLLPLFARKFVLSNDRDALLRFRGTVLVPIDGVDFRPYVETLLRAHRETRIADRVVVITDADPALAGNRKTDLETLATELGARDNLHVFTNEVTLEYELFTAGNRDLLKTVFLCLRPRSETVWDAMITAKPEAEQAQAFVDLITTSRVRKGDFAQELAARIETGEALQVPEYLQQAIRKIAEV